MNMFEAEAEALWDMVGLKLSIYIIRKRDSDESG